MHWQRLDRDATLKVIDSVKSNANEGMFSMKTSEVQRARLPFYNDYSLYKVTNFASLPSFSFQFLSDGTFFHYLDGTTAPIYAVNDKGVLTLNAQNITDYLSFYFEQVGNDEGEDVIMINNPHDMPLLDSLDSEAYDSVFNNYKAPQAAYDDETGIYRAETDLYIESYSVRATVDITTKGRVTLIEQQAKSIRQVMKAPDSGALM